MLGFSKQIYWNYPASSKEADLEQKYTFSSHSHLSWKYKEVSSSPSLVNTYVLTVLQVLY